MESSKDAVYETIQNQRFYDGEINLEKKYHFEASFDNNRETKNLNVSFSLDPKKFAIKAGNNSEEYRDLIERMLHTVDMLYEASNNYSIGNSKNLRIATKNCVQFCLEKITNFQSPYNTIHYEFIVQYIMFLYDLMAFALSKSHESSNTNLPQLSFDKGKVKDHWDEDWTDEKKSSYIQKLLSVMIVQTKKRVIQWCKHNSLKDHKDEIKEKFDEFKKVLETLQEKLAALDAKSNPSTLSAKSNPSFLVRLFECCGTTQKLVPFPFNSDRLEWTQCSI